MVVHELTHECVAPGPHLPHDEEVIARQGHAQAKTGRRLGTCLPHPGQRFLKQLTGCGEPERLGINPTRQFCGIKTPTGNVTCDDKACQILGEGPALADTVKRVSVGHRRPGLRQHLYDQGMVARAMAVDGVNFLFDLGLS